MITAATTKYFAIGAMMNPVSVRLRNIHPASSRPAKLLGHRIHFFGGNGWAEVVVDDTVSDEACMHGVLHEIIPEELSVLDGIEAGYGRKSVQVQLYDGTVIHDAVVYCRHGDDIERGAEVDQPPSERYRQILTDGALCHGVDPEYIHYLKNHPCIPRAKPDEYKSFDLPSSTDMCREYSIQEIQAADGKDGREYLATIDGKVIKFIGPKAEFPVERWIQTGVNHLEPEFSRICYDPKFGEPPENVQDFSKQHCESVEDVLYRALDQHAGCGGIKAMLECVGIFAQIYNGDEASQ